jgi:hypothetical protein
VPLFCESAAHVSCHGATSSETSCLRTHVSRSANSRATDHVLEETWFREVSAYSTVYPEFARGCLRTCNPTCNPRCRIRPCLKCAIRMLRWFRKSYCLPLSPRLRAASNPLASGPNSVCRYRTTECPVLRRRVVQSSSTHSRALRSQLLNAGGRYVSPQFASFVARALRSRNPDTERPLSYCYELPTQLRLESVANAHTAADLHVRPWV